MSLGLASRQHKRSSRRADCPMLDIYKTLLNHFGEQHWWPAEGDFEVIVGAILTQNTAWKNVEVAIEGLKDAGLLSPEGLREVDLPALESHLRPTGYFRIKARRLKDFMQFLFDEHDGKLESLFSGDVKNIRKELLQVKGIGEETADSILLYAGHMPSFVVDAYTKRVFSRLGGFEINDKTPYHKVKALFEENLPRDVKLFKEYHALIVRLAKEHCNTVPKCGGCPLAALCGYRKES